jgi:hypothetical protein
MYYATDARDCGRASGDVYYRLVGMDRISL